ncbi:unnamed protein product [Auanema sp. JU1783]|nr:unnamed protein product [Auanema sp. JU1783]
MYEGVKADVNREDYLLGKRIDKNFEKYSDAVVDQKPNAFESLMNRRSNQTAHTSTESKITNLNASVIKTEDPLVAVRLQQELRRKEAMENPLVRLKIQKMLLSMATEGKNKKDKKKKKKKKNKKNEHSSDSDSDSEPSSSKIKKRKREKEQRRSLKER